MKLPKRLRFLQVQVRAVHARRRAAPAVSPPAAATGRSDHATAGRRGIENEMHGSRQSARRIRTMITRRQVLMPTRRHTLIYIRAAHAAIIAGQMALLHIIFMRFDRSSMIGRRLAYRHWGAFAVASASPHTGRHACCRWPSRSPAWPAICVFFSRKSTPMPSRHRVLTPRDAQKYATYGVSSQQPLLTSTSCAE